MKKLIGIIIVFTTLFSFTGLTKPFTNVVDDDNKSGVVKGIIIDKQSGLP